MRDKGKRRKILKGCIFLIGFMICCYPLMSSWICRQYQKDAVQTYENSLKSCEETKIQELMEEAVHYNDALFQSRGYWVDDETRNILGQEHYYEILNISGYDVMGSIEIPKINVNLPIYHGVSEEVLSIGVGHLEGSSFPIGGINTRAILTGHRGLPNAKLFTRLDELEQNDLFFIHVLDEVLAYKITSIEVIEPDDVEGLEIVPEKDLVSLITCTPYGINTHRLVVTGERITYEKAQYDSIEQEMMSYRELVFLCIPFLFLGFAVFRTVKNKRKR